MLIRAIRMGVAATLALALAACGTAGASSTSMLQKDVLVVGVKSDQPGLGVETKPGVFEGFDVDIALELAKRLGFARSEVVLKSTPSKVREDELMGGGVDMIVASYSITPERKTKVGFAGPYYVAHQDTLVRAGDTAIKSVRDLEGKRLCAVSGSNSWKRVTEEKGISAPTVEAGTYSECIEKLKASELDAVTTDDLILAGFQAGSAGVKIVNAPFTDERYGVGLRKTDIEGCEAVNKAITDMYLDGTARKLLRKWFGKTNLRLTTSVPQFEGCG